VVTTPPPDQLPQGAGLATSLANRALLAAETALMDGRRTFLLRLEFADVRGAAAAAAKAAGCAAASAGSRPWALFDASASTLVVDAAALRLLQSALAPQEQAEAAARLVTTAVDALAGSVQQVQGFRMPLLI
jgi:hypothetical protein